MPPALPNLALTPPAAPVSDLPDLPGELRHLTIGTFHWVREDSLAATIGLAAAVLLYLLFVGLRALACRWLGDGHDIVSWRGFLFGMVHRTRSFFLAMLAAHLVARFIAPPGTLLAVMRFGLTVAAVVQGAVWARVLILGLVMRRAVTNADNHTLTAAINIIKVLVNFVVWAIAAILLLDNIGVNVTGLVAGLGVGGIAIGLAAQGIFRDLFAALAILFDQPFRIGDTIRFGDVTGKVEAIGLKTVRIRSITGEQVIVANDKLLEQQIRNLRRIETRTSTLLFQLDLGATPSQLRKVPEALEAVVANVTGAIFDHAHIVRVTAIAVEVEVEFAVNEQPLRATLDARQAVIFGALEAFAALGVRPADTTPREADRAAPNAPPPAAPDTPTAV